MSSALHRGPSGTARVLLALMLAAAVVARADLALYPDSRDALNPRVPVVAPVPGGHTGLAMPAETRFTYSLAGRVAFPGGGRLRVALRDNARRPAKELLALVSGRDRLSIRVASAAEGRAGALAWSTDGRQTGALALPRPATAGWTLVELDWDAAEARCRIDGREVGRLPLSAPFSPDSVSLETWHVDELFLSGDGAFGLDWENGYAATLRPAAAAAGVRARLHGFDAFAVGPDPARRDHPAVQLLNAGPEAATVRVAFALRREITGIQERWTRDFTVPARSDLVAPIAFFTPLGSDIHHLDVAVEGAELEGAASRHFFSVERRGEPAGPPKFGLHDANDRTFGSWPDALPIHLIHTYARWGYIVGPAWIRDFNGASGIDPGTSPEEWNWNRRVDWGLAQGLTPYVCLESTPLVDWQRAREFPGKMHKRDWGLTGGFPNLDLYRRFVRAFAERYRGRVPFYEVENEPNSSHSGLTPQDYVEIARAVGEEVRAVDSAARVYGISGTANFVPFTAKVFEAGGAQHLDGVSIHTYVTPQLPEQANLPGKLAELHAVMARAGKPLSLVNSETGTYVALREEVDRPISPERLAELIKLGTPTLAVPKGWPNNAQDEARGAVSIVRNATYNFLAGVERFVFFGWNPEWPNGDWGSRMTRPGGGFALVSATREGVRTPSLQTLAIGVFTAQMEGVLPGTGKSWEDRGVNGGSFAKADGGELAVLWSALGRRSVLLETAEPEIELVTLHGQRRALGRAGATGRQLHALELGEEPVYLHARRPGLALQASPVINVTTTLRGDGRADIGFTLVNRSERAWRGNVSFTAPAGWAARPAALPFDLAPGARVALQGLVVPPLRPGRHAETLGATLALPDGTPFTFPVNVEARPVFKLVAPPASRAPAALSAWLASPDALRLDQPDQAVIGRPPALTSIQEDAYWQGPAELSARAKLAHDAQGLLLYVEVTDPQARAPEPWPGVKGSSVEVFFDFRAPGSGFGAPYGSGAHQIVLKPALAAGEAVELWQPSAGGPLAGVDARGGPRSGGYWLSLRVPWAALGGPLAPGVSFGFDLGVNGPRPGAPGRKTQLMLFGTAANSSDPSRFGLGVVGGN